MSNTKKSININAVIHYALLYLLIVLQGSVYLTMNQFRDPIYIFTLLMDFILFVFYVTNKKCITVYYAFYFAIISILLLGTGVFTFGSLGISSILNILSRLLLVYCAYEFDRDKVFTRYIRITSFLSVVSLFFFFIKIINLDILLKILIEYPNTVYYATPFYAHSTISYLTKNMGVFQEPGLHQILLGSVLFLLLFANEKLEISRNELLLHILVVSVTLISTKTTSGYLSLLILYGLFLLKRDKGVIKQGYYAVIGVGGVAAIADLCRGEKGLIYSNVIYRLFSGKAYSPKGRVYSMICDMRVWRQYPLGAGYKIYEKLWSGFVSEGITGYESASCCGLTKNMATIGTICTTAIIAGLIILLFKNYAEYTARVAYLLLFTMYILCQPDIIYTTMALTLLCGNYGAGKNLKFENIDTFVSKLRFRK